MASVKTIVPSWRWRPVTWQHLFPGVPQASSEADKEFRSIPILHLKIHGGFLATFTFGNDLKYNSVYCVFFSKYATGTTLDLW